MVMSGDTGFYSGTRKLVQYLPNHPVEILPGISSLSYLCARLSCSYEDVACVSLHGGRAPLRRRSGLTAGFLSWSEAVLG